MKKEELTTVGIYNFMPYEKGENRNFCVFQTDPILLHPSINDKELNRKEVYNLRIGGFFCGNNTGSHKGQIKLSLYFKSMKEMFNVYVELRRLGYRLKIENECPKKIDEVIFNLDTIKKSKSVYLFSDKNSLSIWLTEKKLPEFKNDLLLMRKILGYRCLWGFEDIVDGVRCINKNYKYII